MAQLYKELRRKEPTSLHTDLAKYIKAMTGHEADVDTVKLTLLLAPIYRTSEENEARRAREQATKDKAEQARLDAIEAKKQAIVDRKAAEKAEKVARAKAKLDALMADDDERPARVAKSIAKAVPVRTPAKPVKRVAKVVSIKRTAKPAAAPTAEVGQIRETETTEDDGWGDGETTEPDAY